MYPFSGRVPVAFDHPSPLRTTTLNLNHSRRTHTTYAHFWNHNLYRPATSFPMTKLMENKGLTKESPESKSTFCEDRLNVRKGLDDVATGDAVLQAFARFRDSSKPSVGDLANLLNAISSATHASFAKKKQRIVFIEAPGLIQHHPKGHPEARPALVALTEWVAKALYNANSPPSWHHIVSMVEEQVKAETKAGPTERGTFLGLANQARPDMVCMLGLSVSPEAYWILYSCPSGLETSEKFSWDDLKPLISYVYTLYRPRRDQPYYDTTIKLTPRLPVTAPPTWNVRVANQIHRSCIVKTVDHPWSPMTWIALTPGVTPFVIKDSYRHESLDFVKAKHDFILREHNLPLNLLVSASLVKAKRKKLAVTVGSCTRTKMRVVMATSGDSLDQLQSLDLLKVL